MSAEDVGGLISQAESLIKSFNPSISTVDAHKQVSQAVGLLAPSTLSMKFARNAAAFAREGQIGKQILQDHEKL